MLNQINQAKRYLAEQGVGSEERVVIIASNSVAYACFICACWELAVTVVPLSNKQPKSVVDKIISDVDPALIISDDLGNYPSAIELNLICSTELNLFSGVSLADLDLDFDAIADIIFTSGSTGDPKGVIHSLSNHYHSALGAHEIIPFNKGNIWMAALPFYHISGLSLILRALLHGGMLYFPKAGESVEDCLGEVSHISLVPVQLSRLLQNESSAQRMAEMDAVLVGGAPLNRVLRDKSRELGLPLFTTYGSSEMSSQITTTSGKGVFADNNSGQLLAGRELMIADDGEILVRGEVLCRGYLVNGVFEDCVDEDSWFHTNDIGRLNEGGDLFVRGRKDLMFISGGENIFPEEIESALESHPSVLRAVVVARECGEFGQRPVAFIKFAGGELCFDELKAFLSDRIAGFKIPDVVYPWPDSLEDNIKIPRSYFVSQVL